RDFHVTGVQTCALPISLREEADRQAILEGLRDGTIDVIATDHAPHHIDEKDVEYPLAAFGITGLETAVGLALDRLVRPGLISLEIGRASCREGGYTSLP